MLKTPFDKAAWTACRPSPGCLGSRFTQAAIAIDNAFVTLNVGDVRPGDVILFARPSLSRTRKNPVYRFQRLLFEPAVARWTHCAIVDENLTVWDAMPSANVRSRPLRELLREDHHIKLVRPFGTPDPTRLRTSLLQFSNHQYRVFTVATLGRLGARLLRAGRTTPKGATDRSILCSIFVADVLRRAALQGYFKHLPIALPADFLIDADFSEIPIHWCRAEP